MVGFRISRESFVTKAAKQYEISLLREGGISRFK